MTQLIESKHLPLGISIARISQNYNTLKKSARGTQRVKQEVDGQSFSSAPFFKTGGKGDSWSVESDGQEENGDESRK